MPAAKGKVSIVAEVPAEFRADLDKRAEAEGRSRAQIIERACRFYLRYAPVQTDDIPAPVVEPEKKRK
jgi:predicted transcriptional regulator